MNEEQIKRQELIEVALFGNRDTGEPGAIQKIDEMYQAWSALIWLGKAITAVALFAAAVGTAWMAFGKGLVHFVKSLFTN